MDARVIGVRSTPSFGRLCPRMTIAAWKAGTKVCDGTHRPHARACRGNPRLQDIDSKKDVDARDKPGHDRCCANDERWSLPYATHPAALLHFGLGEDQRPVHL